MGVCQLLNQYKKFNNKKEQHTVYKNGYETGGMRGAMFTFSPFSRWPWPGGMLGAIEQLLRHNLIQQHRGPNGTERWGNSTFTHTAKDAQGREKRRPTP